MGAKIKLSRTVVEKLTPEQGKQLVFWDQDISGYGIRVSAGGSKTFFYQDRLHGKVLKITIGKFGKVTAEQARKEAKKLQAQIELGTDPRQEKPPSLNITFGHLMTLYVAQLKAEGKVSAKRVENQIKADIETPFPRLWKRDAKAITMDDCFRIVDRLILDEKPRQADKIRSYIKTAYSRAINAKRDPNAPSKLRGFGIISSPISDMVKVKGSSQAKDRALSLAELKAYWRNLDTLPEPKRSIGMLHILTGGQRQDQLRRATVDDLDYDLQSITLYDGKGRREQARMHVIPLHSLCMELISNIGSGPYIFSADGGRTPMSEGFLRGITKKACEHMANSDDLEKGQFTAGTIRATIETRLAAKPYRVSSDVLAQLLSHGLGGVQAKHYQHHDFFDEKLEALEMIIKMVKGE